MAKQPQSTFDREVQNSVFREQFEAAYTELLLSELIEELIQPYFPVYDNC